MTNRYLRSAVLRLMAVSAAAIMLLQLGACRTSHPPFAAVASPRPVAAATLRAGFARVDITPPPGAGLMGWASEGPAARGHRQRLFARAMVLEDQFGERYAFVGLDLDASAVSLHRRVAQLLVNEDAGVGVDRLVIAATHTHSGPTHFHAVDGFDNLSADVEGYDAVLTDSLVERIARAVRAATVQMRPAVAAWGLDTVWGFTRNRTFPAFQTNHADIRLSLQSKLLPTARLSPREAAVEGVWAMLRVDFIDAGKGRTPAGALSVFAIHGTGMSGGLDLYDADIPGMASRLIEDSISSRRAPLSPQGVHLFLNGSAGDVTPNIDAITRCPIPMLVRDAAARGPHGGAPRSTWQLLPRDVTKRVNCEVESIREVRRVATGLAGRAVTLWRSLENKLGSNIEIQRAFRTIHVSDRGAAGGLLCVPREGIASLLGGPDGATRFRWNWELLGSDSATYAPLPSAARAYSGNCQANKRVFLGRLQPRIASLPTSMQLSLVKIGAITIATVPAEPTSNSAWILRRIIATELHGPRSNADSVIMVGYANGYVHYLASPTEYRLQFYEGAATIFGPHTVTGLGIEFASLAKTLRTRTDVPVRIDTIRGSVKKQKNVTLWNRLPSQGHSVLPSVVSATHWADSLSVNWIGAAPSAFYGADSTRLIIDELKAGQWVPVAWDNMIEVNLHVTWRPDNQGAYRLRWFTEGSRFGALRFRIENAAGHRCFRLDDNQGVPC